MDGRNGEPGYLGEPGDDGLPGLPGAPGIRKFHNNVSEGVIQSLQLFLANPELLVSLVLMGFLDSLERREKLEPLVILDPLDLSVLLVITDFPDSPENLA